MQMNEIISVLQQARQSAGAIDAALHDKATEQLVTLRDRILEYNSKLDGLEVPPTGDDYNEVLDMLGLSPSQQIHVGKLWWEADNAAEAEQWKRRYLDRGALSVELKPESDRPIVSVIITLDRNRAWEIIGHKVGDEEWLDLSE